jgi:hypothetical protein
VLTCYRTRRRIGAYLDDALGDRASSRAAAHIGTCARCQSELVSLRRLATMLRQSAPVAPLPEWTGFWEGIVRRIDASPVAMRARPRWRPRLVAASAAALVVGVSVALWQTPWSPSTSRAVAAISVNSADTTHPGGTVMVYTPPEKDLAVVWLFSDD